MTTLQFTNHCRMQRGKKSFIMIKYLLDHKSRLGVSGERSKKVLNIGTARLSRSNILPQTGVILLIFSNFSVMMR